MSLVHLPDTRKTLILARDRYNVKETMLISSCIAIGKRKKTGDNKKKETDKEKISKLQNGKDILLEI